MKSKNIFTQSFLSFRNALIDVKDGYDYVGLSSNTKDKDFEAILSNPEDREIYNKAIQKLKDNRMKANGKKTDTVVFSDRTLEISIE